MKRLVELPDTDRLTARAHALVQAMGRTVESEERLLRVRRSLDVPTHRGAPRWAWRVALAVGMAGAGAAAAAGGSAWLGAPEAPEAPAERGVRVTPAVDGKRVHAPTVANSPELPPPAPSAVSAGPVSISSARIAPPHVVASPLSDVARVHEAAKALRHDGDPERALQLLERPGARISGPLRKKR